MDDGKLRFNCFTNNLLKSSEEVKHDMVGWWCVLARNRNRRNWKKLGFRFVRIYDLAEQVDSLKEMC